MDRLLLIRHAEATASDASDPGLSPAGREQAERLGELLATSQANTLLHGPRQRARETAELLGQRLGLRPTLSELLEDRTPYPSDDRADDYSRRQWDYLRSVPPEQRDINGAMMAEAWRRLTASEHPGTVIAVTHAFVVGSFVGTALGAAPDAWMKIHLGNTGITELHRGNYGDWVVDGVNGVEHLRLSGGTRTPAGD